MQTVVRLPFWQKELHVKLSTLTALALSMVVAPNLVAQQPVEAESLSITRHSSGEPTRQDMTGLVEDGLFSNNHIVHWSGVENIGDLIEFKVPVARPGKYTVTLGIAKSWDYGIYQPMVDGRDVGPELDLYCGGPEDRTFPAVVEIGTIDAMREYIRLAMRYTGSNPASKSEPLPGGMGLDWVMMTPVEKGSSAPAASTNRR